MKKEFLPKDHSILMAFSIFMKNFLKVKNLPFNDNTVLRLDNIRDYLFNSENDIEVEISKQLVINVLKKRWTK